MASRAQHERVLTDALRDFGGRTSSHSRGEGERFELGGVVAERDGRCPAAPVLLFPARMPTVRAELDRLSVTSEAGDELTATEQRVADLAATGLTVREVAAALLVRPKTVEAHLTRICRKLDIHSRAELGRIAADRSAGRM